MSATVSEMRRGAGRARIRNSAPSGEAAWLVVAAVLLGTGWGSNQFTPMLLVYHHALGLSTGTLEAMFGAYAVGLIPGTAGRGTAV